MVGKLYYRVVQIWNGSKEVARFYDKKSAQEFVKANYSPSVAIPFDTEKLVIETRKEILL